MTEAGPDLLREYDRYKLDLSDALRLALENAKNAGGSALVDGLKSVLVRLASDQFYVAFVGQFSRGKSTVMNALVGRALLPVGVVPLTSVITVVKYGSRPRVIIRFPNSLLTREINVSELSNYVTQTENPGNVKGVERAEIQTPSDLLLRGVCLVDTPGLGSLIEANTRTTQGFLPEVDAFVVVTAVDSPVTQDEALLLRDGAERGKKLFLVMNKSDLLREDRLVESVRFVRGVAGRISSEIQVYIVSARHELEVRTGATGGGPTESWAAFEGDLRFFLAQQRAAPFLINNCDRIIELIQGRNGDAGTSRILDRVVKIKSAVRKAGGLPADDMLRTSAQPVAKQTCFICNGVASRVHEFLAKYQYQITTDADAREQHASIQGFCDLHTWQYERVASPRGICTAYPPLLERTSEKVETDFETIGHESCPACEVQFRAERELAGQVAGLSADQEHSTLVCLPHLKLVAKLGYTREVPQLARNLSAILVHMAETMQRFAMKQEALRRDLQSEEEQYVHRRALALLVGHPQLRNQH
jgi:GTPase SAR1 family protein